jgi:hypothetical protein
MKEIKSSDSKKESLSQKPRRSSISFLRFIISSDYIKFRVGGLIIILIIFLMMGQLLTKDTLLITSLILGYILLTWIIGREKRDKK